MKRILAVLACMAVAAVHAQEIKMPNFMQNTNVGDWVLAKASGNVQIKQTVIEKTDKHIVVKTEMIMGGTVINTSTNEVSFDNTYDPDKYDEKDGKPTITKGKVKLKGEEIECWVFTKPSPNGGTLKAFFSEKVPINGMVRSEFNDEVTLELVDYGRAK